MPILRSLLKAVAITGCSRTLYLFVGLLNKVSVLGELWRWHYRSGLLGPVETQAAALIPVALSALPTNEIIPTPTERVLSIRCVELHITLPGEIHCQVPHKSPSAPCNDEGPRSPQCRTRIP